MARDRQRVRDRRLPALLLALILAAGFAGPGATAPTARSAPAGSAIPTTPAGMQLAWSLEMVNTGAAGVGAAEIAPHFSDDFLAALPAADLLGVFAGYLAPNGPMTVARFEGGVTATRAYALLTAADGQPWRVRLGVEASDPFRINELFFEPVALPAPLARPPTSWAAFDKQITRVAPEVGFVAAEITDGSCELVRAVNADEQLAVGSAFKLYVLGELARQVETGTARWDERLRLRAGLKSLPVGALLYEPNGARFPLVYYAERMTAESDNTATDHLIDRLGREHVERIMGPMGHADPAANVPLLMTREWFAIKLRLSRDQIEHYLAADDAEQRRFLAETVDPLAGTLWDGEEWFDPYLIDSIEWFASANDLCRAMLALKQMAERPGLTPVFNALSLNPAIAFDPAAWTYVGYKGGYETGVKSDVWLLQRADGRWFAMAAIINDPRQEINGIRLNQLMVPAAALLARAD